MMACADGEPPSVFEGFAASGVKVTVVKVGQRKDAGSLV